MDDLEHRLVRELVNEVCLGKSLSDHEKSFLSYMREHAGNARALSEDAIAFDFLHLDKEKWNKSRSTVRTMVARVRSGLRAHFQDPRAGRRHPRRLIIPERPPYHLELADNLQADAVVRFWEPHFANSARNLIISTEPLFFYDAAKHCFI